MGSQEVRFSLGEKSNRMVTVTMFMGNLKVHIRQFYGEKKAGRSGITLNVEEFDELVKLIPKVRENIAKYEVRDTGIPASPFELDLPVLDLDSVFLPSPPSQDPELELPKFPTPPTTQPDLPPFADSPLEKFFSDLREEDKSQSAKRKCMEERPKKKSKKSKTETGVEGKRTTGLFIGQCKIPLPENKVAEKKKKKKIVKKECMDEVDSVEGIKEVEKELWLEHYNQLCEKLLEVVHEKCSGCQTDKANQLGHELCLMVSVEERVHTCFEEAYRRVNWDDVMDRWYEKVLEIPIVLNPGTLGIFRESVNPEELAYKNRLKKWLIESPTIEL